MRHIWHIEEFFTGRVPYKDTEKLLEHLNSGDVLNASIKIDGSPAVTFGYDEAGAWSSTKSVFNKQPVKFRDNNGEWFNKLQEPVQRAVTDAYNLANRIVSEYPNNCKDVIFIGDYLRLCDRGGWQMGFARHHSNVIAYDNIVNGSMGLSKNLIMAHSALLPDKSIIHPRRKIKLLGSGIYTNAPALTEMPYTPESNLAANQNVLAIVNILNGNPELADVFTAVIKTGQFDTRELFNLLGADKQFEMVKRTSERGKAAVQKRFAEAEDVLIKIFKANDVINDYVNFMYNLYDIKNKALEELNTLAKETTGIECYIKQNGKYISTSHEGFVINIPNTDIRVKLVDINTFTKHNNDDTVYKPWREE